MTYDGSNRKHVRQAEKTAAIATAARLEYTRIIMSTLAGREWMHAFLTKCHVFHTPFSRGAPDVTAFLCGEQNLGLQIFADVVNAAPTEYVLMMQEAMQKERVDDGRYSDNRVATEPAGTESRTGRDDQGPIVATDYDPYEDGPDEDRTVN